MAARFFLLTFFLLTCANASFARDNGSTQDSSKRSKVHLNIGTLGHPDHGTTTLTAAIMEVLWGKARAQSAPPKDTGTATAKKSAGITATPARVEYRTETRHYVHYNCPGHTDCIRDMITGAARMEAAILVVSATEGLVPQAREQLRLARVTGVSRIIVFLNRADLVEDPELLDLVEHELREILVRYGFPGDDTPIIRGNASRALKNPGDEHSTRSIRELLRSMDEYFIPPTPPEQKSFLMPVQSVLQSPDQGTVVTGRIRAGSLRVGQEIARIGLSSTETFTVKGIQMFRKKLDEARAPDTVGIILDAVDRKSFRNGQVLAEPGSIASHNRFRAEVYLLSAEEGGRSSAIFNGYRPQFYFFATDITGEATFPAGMEMVLPGETVGLDVTLKIPVAMKQGTRFAIREGTHTVGAGMVTEILE